MNCYDGDDSYGENDEKDDDNKENGDNDDDVDPELLLVTSPCSPRRWSCGESRLRLPTNPSFIPIRDQVPSTDESLRRQFCSMLNGGRGPLRVSSESDQPTQIYRFSPTTVRSLQL